MKSLPPPTYDNLEELAGLAFGYSRDVATAIRVDLLPHLPSGERSGPLQLLKLLDERRVFERQVLVEIGNLERLLADMISQDTAEIDHLVEDEAMVTPAVWRQKILTPEADALSNVLVVLVELQTLVHAVLDILDAERAIEHLRQRGSA